MVNCCLNGVSVDLLLDLGAKVSILNSKVYFDALAAQPPLQPPVIALRTYSGSGIPCLGCVTLDVELNGAILRDFRFYVTEHGCQLLVWTCSTLFVGQFCLVVTVSSAAVRGR